MVLINLLTRSSSNSLTWGLTVFMVLSISSSRSSVKNNACINFSFVFLQHPSDAQHKKNEPYACIGFSFIFKPFFIASCIIGLQHFPNGLLVSHLPFFIAPVNTIISFILFASLLTTASII